jgi:hypothetical protein
MTKQEEILSKIEEWEKALEGLDNLLLKTEDAKTRAIYLNSKRKLKDNIKLLEWVVY